ncbi:hypothetical protein FB451DRAFT_1279819 [Mycena latifolia]|nr:hypothetical protein FB451DRAFT_1279819 [Mycena latifolia]
MPPRLLPILPTVLFLLLLPRLVPAVALEQPQQQHPLTLSVLHAPPASGTLRKFLPTNPESFAEVLRFAQDYDLDVWHAGRGRVDVYEPAKSAGRLPGALLDTPHEVHNLSLPVAPARYKAEEEDWDLHSLENSTFHSTYHPQAAVDAFILALAHTYPDSVSVFSLGHSAEGREMHGLKISAPPPKNGTQKDVKMGFVVIGPQHAREWVATSTALYLAHALLANASEPHSLAYLLEAYDFHIIPAPNPDGYVYTWEADRFWYKNRQVVGPGAKCIGIDMNRNWGAHWKPHAKYPLFGPSNNDDDELKKKKKKAEPADPCSHWYPGHRAFEATEVANIAGYLTKVQGVGKGAKGGVQLVLELRSYGQMLAAPYSYKCDRLPKDAEDQTEALHGAAQAGKSVWGTPFMTGTLCELLYRAPGNLLDYVYSSAGTSVKYAYAAFLRDTGTYGFALPPEWIRPVGEETAAVAAYLGKFVARQKGIAL